MPRGFFAESEMLSSRKVPLALFPKCGECGLLKTCLSPKMPVSGDGELGILIVAEAPGEEEDKQNLQLVGKTGRLLEKVLRRVGIDMRRDCWLTNALICRPPGNATPTTKQVDACRPNLVDTIIKLKPTTIIPLGQIAIDSLLPLVWKDEIGSITKWAGWTIPEHSYNAWICPSFHPSYISRQKDDLAERIYEKQLRRATSFDERPWQGTPPDYAKRIECIHSPALAAEAVYWFIDNCELAAFDYETNMLKPDAGDAEIISCSISNGERTIAFPWAGPVVAAMKEFIVSPVRKIASNLKFEDRWTRAFFNRPVANWDWDTMLAAHVLDCRAGITGIKFQAFIRYGAPAYDNHIEPLLRTNDKTANSQNRAAREIALNQLLIYNGLDSLLEYKVAIDQKKEMDDAQRGAAVGQ